MIDLPPPLTASDVDLQDFPFMPLHVARLRDSDLAAEEHPEACWYAVLLWAASWHQIPAGSLPDNETVLCKLIGLGRDLRTFKKHRDGMLRGFVKCSDGRLYHRVIAEQAAEAWDSKLKQRHRTLCAAIRKHNERNPENLLASPSFEEWVTASCPTNIADHVTSMSRVTQPEKVRDIGSKGQGQGQGQSIDEEEREREPFVWPADALGLSNELTRLAGVPNTQPAAISRNLTVVQDWIRDGMDPEADIVPVIRQTIVDAKETIGSLRYFDAPVRQQRARRDAGAAGVKGKHLPPAKPMTIDEQIAWFERSAAAAEQRGQDDAAAEFRSSAEKLRRQAA